MEDRKNMNNVQSHIHLIKEYFVLNLSASMEYRSSFLVQFFGMFLNNLSFAFFWWVMFEQFNSIGGYGFKDVMMLWAFSSAGFGLCFIFFGNTTSIVNMVVKGELDSYLLQPKNVLINVLSSKTNISAWGDLAYGIILFFLVKGADIKAGLLFILFSVTGALIYASVLVTFQSLAFFYGKVDSLASLVFEFLVTLSIYPADIFQGLVRFILFTIIPSGFISMMPVQLINHFDIRWMVLLMAALAAWISIAFIVFYKGLKRYESGNLMVQKM